MSEQNTPRLLLTPLKSALIADHAQRVRVLVRIQSPDADPSRVKTRPPYHLALVIDRSGSMSGAPLFEAKRCARHIIDQLRPDDRAALVQFDDRVRVLVPAQPVDDRHALHQTLEDIHEGGSTNLHGGWEAGARCLADFVQQAGLSRVILLSDGNANRGLTDAERIAEQCGEFARQGVTTSTYGLGHHFNEDLMVAMARAGQGNHYYGETAQDLFEPFAEEFDLITNLYARQLRLTLGTPQGMRATLLNDYPLEDLRGFPVARLPDLAWGAEAWALVEIELSAPAGGAGPVALLQAEVTASDLDGNPIAFPEAQLKLPVVSLQAWEALLPDPLVQRRLDELEAGRMLEQARAAARLGDWAAVEALLNEARRRYANNPWVQQVLETMARLARRRDEQGFAKEALFSTRRMHSRLADKEEMMRSLSDEAQAPAFLRRKAAQGKAQFRKGPEGQETGSGR